MDKKGLMKYWKVGVVFALIGILGLVLISSVDVAIQDCVAQESAGSSGTWGTACDNSYPSNTLFYDDSNYEIHQVSKSGPGFWAGLRINSSDTSVIDCESITNVDFCYKWWSVTPYVISCDISVDSDNGTSYSAVTTTCPGTTEPGSITCTDVTSLESWTCEDFFGNEGALAKSELVHSGAGANGNFDVTWDVFYFNVSYSNISCTENLVNTSWSSWVNESCVSDTMNQSRFLTQYDSNNCGASNLTIYESQLVGPSLVNTTWSNWVNISCLASDTMNQSRSLIEFDIYSCASNTTFYEYRNTEFCDYCTPNLVNTSWSSWVNESCIGDEMNQSRFLTQYDSNVCGEVSNLTIYESQLVGPSLVNTSWSSWVNISCLVDDTMNQSRNLTQYDIYSCAGDIIFYEYRNTEFCDYCTPNLVNTSWSSWTNISCLADDTMNQSRFLTQYDSNVCGEIANQTIYEYQNISSCDYCTPNLVNTSWSSWYNVSSCYLNNTIDQERNLTQSDSNVCGEVSNQTFYEYRVGNCTYPDLVAPSLQTITSENVTTNSTSIEWSTNEPSNSSVNYGSTLSLGSYAGQDDSVEDHYVMLTNLENDTTYYYNVTSCDASGNCNTSATYNFTTEEIEIEVEVNETIEDSQGNPMNVTFEIFDENYSLLYNQTSTSHSQGLAKGHYKIKIYPKNHPIKKIEFRDIYINESLNGILDIDDPSNNGPWSELYAINPVANLTNVSFVVTGIASSGSSIIYKCLLWNFTNQVCRGDWAPFIDVREGQEYNLTLDFVDPGLAEGNGTFFESYESGSFDTYNWTTYGSGAAWTVSTDDAYAGAYHAQARATGAALNSYLEVNVSTVGYENMNVSYYRRLVGMDGVDNFVAEWYNGTNWSTFEELGGDSANEPAYSLKEYQLSSFADNNPSVRFRFMCENGAVSEYCRVDNFFVNGSAIVPDTTNPAINSASDSPDPVINGTEITITANITDDVGVDIAWVEINNINYSMNQLSALSGNHEDILYDDFESGSLSFNFWSLSGTGEYWVGSSTNASTGVYHAQAYSTGVGDPSYMEVSKSTSGYTNISVSYERKLVGLDAVDYFTAEFYNGTGWSALEELGSGIANDASYLSKNFTLNASANDNSNFKLRFMCECGGTIEYCRVDNVNISGILSSSPTDDWQYKYLTNTLGEFNYTIYSNDTSSNNATSVNGNFSVIEGNISIVESVRDANGTAINTTLEIIDETNTTIYNETGTSHYKQIGKGRYKIKVKPKNHKIRKIEFDEVNISYDLGDIIDIDDPVDNLGYNELVSFNPLISNTTENDTLTVTLTAANISRNKILYKCGDWDFSNQNCTGNWTAWMAISPGQEYNAIFLFADPGLAEGNGTFFEGFESGSLGTNNWTASGGGSNDWIIINKKTTSYAGDYHVSAADTDGESVMVTNISVEEYQGIVFSFYAKTIGLDSGEYVAADWYNGSEWKNLLAQTQVINDYTLYNYTLDSTADNNADLRIRFRCSNDVSNEYCKVDNVRVDGMNIADSSGPVINLYNPQAITYSSNESIDLNFSVSDSNGVESCWYNLDNGGNTTINSCVNTTFNVTGEGSFVLNLFSNDTLGNEETSNVNFNVDLTGVNLSISEPVGAKTSITGIPISYNAEGNNLSCFYNVKTSIGGDVIGNTSLVNCSSSSFDVSSDGSYAFNLYVNNSLGTQVSENSSFSVSTPSGETGGSSGGGGGGTTIVSGTSVNIELEELRKMILEAGDYKEIKWEVKNTGTRFLNDCRIKGEGNYSSWIFSEEIKNLAAGEEHEFSFDLSVGEDAVFGEYNLLVVLECGGVSKGGNLLIEILEKQLKFDLIHVERESDESVLIRYSIEELSGIDQNVELQFLLFDSENEKAADIQEIKLIGANSKEEFESIIFVDPSLHGDLNLLINLNSETYSGFVQEDIVLGRITGFASFGEVADMDNILTGILIVGFIAFAFFIVRKMFLHKKGGKSKIKKKKKSVKKSKRSKKSSKSLFWGMFSRKTHSKSTDGVPESLKRKVERQKDKIRGKKGFFRNIFSRGLYKDERGVVLVDNKIIGILEKAAEGKDCKGKYIHLKFD